ncbi:MAG: DUF4870 domain-containing protein [Phycisphaerae bacterium]|jgi:hypothetical protein
MAEVNEAPKPIEESKDARTFAMLAHLLAIFTCFVGPLVIWLIKKDEHPFVDEQGKEALNFQITIAIAYVAASLLSFLCIGFLLFPAVGVVDLIFCIMACVAANKGEHYRYPVSIRFIK